ncbi:hypothetical protein KUTeg_009623 [Tegillarca granosa]|uniref:Uncharacterized protein n=1 Tax=Tegillarca granosa TaxID=220873 RepID=A0ABQ9F7J2_TEGGR|nr:hypothetical protein KUTeg_009623 [Tegillarca granosa]
MSTLKKPRQGKGCVTPRTFVNGEIHRKTSDSEKRAVVKGERTLLRVTKSGSDTSLGGKGNSLREIKLGEESDHGHLHHSKDLKMHQLSNSQEIPKIVDFVENHDEK